MVRLRLLRSGAAVEQPGAQRWWFAAWTLALLAAWTPYLLLFWPGVLLGDSFASVGPMVGDRPLENHHPVAFTLFVGVFLRLGEMLGMGITNSMALFSVAQMIVMAVGLAYAAHWLVRRTAVTNLLGSLVVVFFALTPVFPIYGLNMQKDTLFAVATLLLVLRLADLALTRGAALRQPRTIAAIGALGVWMTLWRNGGSVVVAIAIVAVVVIWRRAALRLAVVTAAGVLACTVAISTAEATVLESAPTAEKLAIPLQQVAAALHDGTQPSAEDAAVLDQVLPLELWSELYAPARVDAVKWSDEFDDAYLDAHAGEFLRVWAGLAPEQIDVYARAWALETFGFWTPGAKNDYGFIDTGMAENPFGIERLPKIDSVMGLSADEISDGVDFLGSGTLAWILLISACGVFLSRRPAFLVAHVPLLAIWIAGLAATPVAFSLRYVFSWALALPFLVLAPVLVHHARCDEDALPSSTDDDQCDVAGKGPQASIQ